MSSKMLHPKKSHWVRNFFLIVAALFVGIIVIANLQPAQDATAPSQTTTSSQATTQPSPAPVAATTTPESSPAPVATSPEPSEPEPQSIQTSDSSSKSVVVTADEYGDKWPLTVSEARVTLIDKYVAFSMLREKHTLSTVRLNLEDTHQLIQYGEIIQRSPAQKSVLAHSSDWR